MDFLILTGVSGAGKTRAMHTLEDIGFYCVDNLPPELIGIFRDLCERSGTRRCAVVTDVRGGSFFSSFERSVDELSRQGKAFRILFLDASDAALINRFKETRRKHPFADRCAGALEPAVALERKMLAPVRERADYLIDTTELSTAQLQQKLLALLLPDPHGALTVHCVSFGFKYGLPREADLVFDVRFMPNPFYVEGLKQQTGLDAPVYDYVMNGPTSTEFIARLSALIDFLIPQYVEEGKTELVLAVGCTGGRHRSVAVAAYLYRRLLEAGYRADMNHRDIHK